MFRNLPHLLKRVLHFLVRLCVVAAVMMVVERVLEELTPDIHFHLTVVQTEALAAVEGINPLQIKDRFFCALSPSVAAINRENPHLLYHPPVSSDCMYTLYDAQRAAGSSQSTGSARPGVALPPRVVGHWASQEDGSGKSMPLAFVSIAFLDTAWHLLVQASALASLFSLFAFVLGGIVTGMAMSLPRFEWSVMVAPIVFCAGTVAAACVVAWGMQMLMEGGLYLFHGVSQLAGLWFGSASIVAFGYHYVMKVIETGIHHIVDHVVPH